MLCAHVQPGLIHFAIGVASLTLALALGMILYGLAVVAAVRRLPR